mmetsp:Transcript_23439/g.51301  ORF Transcript_23439/g.51301 Transcript_23439/m.51301 type:complete len:101 (+) Transcript_23439:213-515(+)
MPVRLISPFPSTRTAEALIDFCNNGIDGTEPSVGRSVNKPESAAVSIWDTTVGIPPVVRHGTVRQRRNPSTNGGYVDGRGISSKQTHGTARHGACVHASS